MAQDVARIIWKLSQEMENDDLLHLKRIFSDKSYSFYCNLKENIRKNMRAGMLNMRFRSTFCFPRGVWNQDFAIKTFKNVNFHMNPSPSSLICEKKYMANEIEKHTRELRENNHLTFEDAIVLVFDNAAYMTAFDKLLRSLDLKLLYYENGQQLDLYLSWEHWQHE